MTTALAHADENTDRRALESLARRYAEGFYRSDPSIVLETVHVELSKKGVVGNFWGQRVDYLEWLQGDRLELAGRFHDHDDRFDANTPSRAVVYAVDGDVAVLELIAADWYDAFTAVRVNGQWKLLDCIWGQSAEYEAPSIDAGESAQVEATVRDFLAAAAVGNRTALDEVIHPNLSVRRIGATSGRVEPLTREMLYAGELPVPNGTANVRVHNATQRSGLVDAALGERRFWVQCLRLNGRWRVVNVHWR